MRDSQERCDRGRRVSIVPIHMDILPPTFSSVSVDAAGAAVNVGASPRREAGVMEESDSVARGLIKDNVWIRQQGDTLPSIA
jgi:hypothetical protein